MFIEEKIFKKYTPDFEKLKDYGFQKRKNWFEIEILFKNDLFKSVVKIDFSGKISGKVYDLENNSEYLPIRVKDNQGAFVGEIRAEYEKLLTDIRDKCCSKEYFIYPQSNRIADKIIKKYGDEPEFLWEKTPGSGVFRNKETKKWYFVILDVDRSKIQAGKKGLIEAALLKLNPVEIEELIQQEHFYKAYHMNKKHWMTIILDETVSDEKIFELIEKSYGYTLKRSRV